jgi:hypothetical protein
MPCPSHPSWLDYSNYTWRRVEVMKLPIMQFSWTSCHFISLSNIEETISIIYICPHCWVTISLLIFTKIVNSLFRVRQSGWTLNPRMNNTANFYTQFYSSKLPVGGSIIILISNVICLSCLYTVHIFEWLEELYGKYTAYLSLLILEVRVT